MKDLNRFYTSSLTNKANYEYVRVLVDGVTKSINARRVLLVTKQMQNTEIVEALIQKNISKKLPTQFPGTKINIVHKAVNNFQSIEEEVFVALGLSSDDILAIEENINSKFLIVAPWYPGEADKWAKITGAILIPEKSNLPPYDKIECLLEQALMSIKSINGGVLHDNDRDLVKTIFTVVLENDIKTDHNQIEAFLYTKFQWSKSKIDKVLEIYETLKAGQRLQGRLLDSYTTLYNRWKEACDNMTKTK